MPTDRRRSIEALVVATGAVLLGQLILILLTPLSRASSEGVERLGVALLSPDSITYLGLASDSDWVARAPWNRALLIALLRAGTLLGEPAAVLLVVQVMVLIVATALTHRLASEIAGPKAGVLAAVVVACNPLVAQWARFVLTETLFLSLMLIALWAGTRSLRGVQSAISGVLLVTTALLATFLRPNGILVLGSAVTTLLMARSARRRGPAIAVVWVMVGFGLLLGLDAAGQPAERTIAEQLYGGIVVEGTDAVRVAIEMPRPDDPDDTSPSAALRYVVAEPLAAARLAVSRIVVESSQMRRHYPLAINISIGAAMMFLLAATLTGARVQGARTLVRATLVLGLPILALVGATFASPEGRYGWGALILTAPTAGVGAAHLIQRVLAPTRGDQSSDGPGIPR